MNFDKFVRYIRYVMEFLGWVMFFAWVSTATKMPFADQLRSAINGVFRMLEEVGK